MALYFDGSEDAFTPPTLSLSTETTTGDIQELRYARRLGFPYAMVFAYHPSGPLLYTGDLHTIRDEIAGAPTHHGFVVHYRGGEKRTKPTGHAVILLGKHAHNYRNGHYLSLQYIGSDQGLSSHLFTGRPNFVLCLNRRHQEQVVLRRWRKLPKCYLKQLKDADRILDEYALP